MSNSYYNHGSYPYTGSSGSSASMRAELDSISAGFAILDTKLSVASTKQLTVSNSITLAGGDAQTYTFPASSGTVLTASLRSSRGC